MLENDDQLIFLGAAILLAQTFGRGDADESHIQAAVTTAHELRGEVKKQLDEIRASGPDPYGAIAYEREKAKGQS